MHKNELLKNSTFLSMKFTRRAGNHLRIITLADILSHPVLKYAKFYDK